MRVDVVMPQMGESIAEGTITRWMKQVGDTVSRDEPIFEISTDKVDAEIPSPAAGRLIEIRNAVGETVPVNQVVAVLETDVGAAVSAAPAAATAKAEAPSPAPAAVQPAATKAPAAEPPHRAARDRSFRRSCGRSPRSTGSIPSAFPEPERAVASRRKTSSISLPRGAPRPRLRLRLLRSRSPRACASSGSRCLRCARRSPST